MSPLGSLSEKTEEKFTGILPVAEVCPVCARLTHGETIALASLPDETEQLIRANAPDSGEMSEVCARCASLFERAKDQIIADAAMQKDGSHVLSTPLRLDADERFTGKGVTIAFLDSGFYPHADLTTPEDRILAYKDLTEADGDISSLLTPDVASWHGMMTSVVAAGNGSLSNGFYRGIAPDANVVLVKLAKTGRISDENILDGLGWVLENREKYSIRIVNISAGGDEQVSYLHDPLSQMVEACCAAGITVVCAVGNSGHLPDHPVMPPASAPSAIAVGGLDDNNSLNRARRGMYRSSYGPTIDGLQKPEVIASSIWVRRRSYPTRRRHSRRSFWRDWIKAGTRTSTRSFARVRASTLSLTPPSTGPYTASDRSSCLRYAARTSSHATTSTSTEHHSPHRSSPRSRPRCSRRIRRSLPHK